MREPSRRYSWPPFAPGHTLSRTHGAYSERELAPLADGLAAEVVDLAPWAARPQFAPGVRRWARAEAIAAKLWAFIAENGPLDADGNPRPALAVLERWEAAAAARGASLGLDPAAMAKLLGALAVSSGNENAAEALDALRAEGRQLISIRAVPPVGDQPSPMDDTP